MIMPPPHDDNDLVIPHDHPDIKNEFEVIRRISEKQLVCDKNGKMVISSVAFKASSGIKAGMSVDIKQFIEMDGKCPKDYVITPRWMGSILFKVSDLRQLEFQVGYSPIPEPEANPYHGEVWGDFSNIKRQKLKEIAVWFVAIENVDIK